jgi:hypothetical protein
MPQTRPRPGKSGDVDKARDVRMISGFRNDDAAIGMADEKNGLGLLVEDGAGRGYVARQRFGRILDDADIVAILLQALVDPFPAGSVDEPSVDEDNRLVCAMPVGRPWKSAPERVSLPRIAERDWTSRP